MHMRFECDANLGITKNDDSILTKKLIIYYILSITYCT